MSPQKRQNLAELAIRFLNFQALSLSSSPHTSKSYATDLNQFLAPKKEPLIFFNGAVARYDLRLDGTIYQHETWNEQRFLQLVHEAQRHWSEFSPATRNRKAACLKSFARWLFQEGYLANDLGARIASPKVPARIPHFISVDEALALIRSLQNDRSAAGTEEAQRAAYSDLILVLLLYGSGLRVSEACRLKWTDIDLSLRQMRILGKGGLHRLGVLPKLAAEELARFKTVTAEDYVFGAGPLSPRKAYARVRAAGARAGLLKPLNPHALRHSFATHMLSGGSDLRALQELLGHQSLVATQKYTHLSLDTLARTLESHHPLAHSARKT